jgi:hypothetical protein
MFVQMNPDSHVVKDARICIGNIDKKPLLAKATAAKLSGK